MKILIVAMVLLTGCDQSSFKTTYIKTDRGFISYGYAYCELGILTNNSMVNILDENNRAIPCQGRVRMTKAEFEATQ